MFIIKASGATESNSSTDRQNQLEICTNWDTYLEQAKTAGEKTSHQFWSSYTEFVSVVSPTFIIYLKGLILYFARKHNWESTITVLLIFDKPRVIMGNRRRISFGLVTLNFCIMHHACVPDPVHPHNSSQISLVHISCLYTLLCYVSCLSVLMCSPVSIYFLMQCPFITDIIKRNAAPRHEIEK